VDFVVSVAVMAPPDSPFASSWVRPYIDGYPQTFD
jgi:hypothetical protein